MTPSGLLTRIRAMLRREEFDAELSEELQYHLEREVERNRAAGMTEGDARNAARRALGNLTVASEQARDDTRWRWFEELRQDLAYAARTFRRTPTFVVTVVATIALGLGLLSSAFTFFDAYVLRPFAIRDPYSLYSLSWFSADGRGHMFTWPQFEAMRAQRGPLRHHIAYAFLSTRLRGRPATGLLVSGNYFGDLGVPAALGRTIVPADAESPESNAVIVLSHRAWQTTFGGDSSVLGARVNVNGTLFTVAGVAREGFGGLTNSPVDFWIPITMIAATGPSPELFGPGAPEGVYVVARLAAGTSPGIASRMLREWMTRQTADRPPSGRASFAELVPRGTSMPRSRKVTMLFAPVGIAFLLVMLIACANVANIMLARGMARQREIGIRLALGAGRRRLIRQLLTEAAVLAVPSGLAGYFVSRVVISGSLRLMFATVPPAYAGHIRLIPLDADLRVLLFMFVAAVIAAIAFGLAPALQSTRPNIVQASRGDFDTQFRPSRLRNALVVGQITFSAMLLACAGVLLSSARAAQDVDPGIRTRNVLQIELNPGARNAAIDALRRDPAIRALASASATPLDGAFSDVAVRAGSRLAQHAKYNVVSPEYFGTIELPIVRGRNFTGVEARSRAAVAIVSQSAARALFPGREALGQIISIPETERDYRSLDTYHAVRIIGVVADAVPGWIGESRETPVVYYARPLDADAGPLVARVDGDEGVALRHIERVLAAVDSGAVQEMHTLGESVALQVYPFRAMYWVALAIGAIALALTLIGVYGVMSYLVAQRRREFGIRIALGASGSSLIALVLRQSLRLALIGVSVGLLLAAAMARLLASLIEVVHAYAPSGYVLGAGVVLLGCVIAAYTPSRRAASADPIEALRGD